jgi:hypothetical protein
MEPSFGRQAATLWDYERSRETNDHSRVPFSPFHHQGTKTPSLWFQVRTSCVRHGQGPVAFRPATECISGARQAMAEMPPATCNQLTHCQHR